MRLSWGVQVGGPWLGESPPWTLLASQLYSCLWGPATSQVKLFPSPGLADQRGQRRREGPASLCQPGAQREWGTRVHVTALLDLA